MSKTVDPDNPQVLDLPVGIDAGHDRMPKEVYHAYGYVKKAAAVVNTGAGRLPAWKGELIQRVCDEVISGALDSEFPLYVWQTGSGHLSIPTTT